MRRFFLVAATTLTVALTSGQAMAAPAVPKAQQWEYLVVSDKTMFDFTLARKIPGDNTSEVVEQETKAKDSGFHYIAKTMVYKLDNLGAQGWELVTVVGTISGDQQYIFKRRKQ